MYTEKTHFEANQNKKDEKNVCQKLLLQIAILKAENSAIWPKIENEETIFPKTYDVQNVFFSL